MGEDDAFAVPAALLPDAETEPRLSAPGGVDRHSMSDVVILSGDAEDDDVEANGGGAPAMVACSSGSSADDNGGIEDSDSDDVGKALTLNPPGFVNPESHISNQFFTFTRDSYSLMVRCILDRRLATPEEICAAAPPAVLASWRSVWKDRNVATAYLTGWKRIQEKLNAHVHDSGNEFLYFKNNPHQYVSHIGQWLDIVSSFHGDADLKHLGLKETVERIKQVWTVGAKFYGIPETFIRGCVASCPICSDAGSSSAGRNKRRRFEYTESFEVPAKEVPRRLQQLAAKHKVVLCIRQKYIRYKPFMAEVKDYACHRAGEPNAKRSRVLKREPYASKRCGCGFRIRAIVPITNYNEKEKSFVYNEDGMAVFKLYAVHSGHEPGLTDGSARLIHTVVSDIKDDEIEFFSFTAGGGDPDASSRVSVLKQVQNLQMEIGELESKVVKMPQDLLSTLSRDLSAIIKRLRSIGDDEGEIPMQKQHHHDPVLIGGHHSGLGRDWNGHQQMHGDVELIEGEDDAEAFERSLECVTPWDPLSAECRSKSLLSENCKPDKWLDSVKEACGEYDEKSMLVCEDTKLVKPIRHEGAIMPDSSLVGIQVDGFYPDNPKWFDSPCPLDPGSDCGDGTFSDGRIM